LSPSEYKDFKSRIFPDLASEWILMKMSSFSEAQILSIPGQAEGGVPVPELCREQGMRLACFCKWRAQYGGMDASVIGQRKALEDENRALDNQA
jgi:putative transposase